MRSFSGIKPEEQWYMNSLCHRRKGPALKRNKKKRWFLLGYEYIFTKTNCGAETHLVLFHGALSSFNDLPSVVYQNGTKEWHLCGKLHRVDGPAVEYSNGDKEYWYLNQRHNAFGPAVILGDKEYWYNWGNFQKFEKRESNVSI